MSVHRIAFAAVTLLPPSVVAGVSAALTALEARPELRARLASNAARLYDGLSRAGFALGPTASPIVSIRLPDPSLAATFWSRLLDAGIYVNLALPPATPGGQSLLRTSVTASHTDAQVDAMVGAMSGRQRRSGASWASSARFGSSRRPQTDTGTALACLHHGEHHAL